MADHSPGPEKSASVEIWMIRHGESEGNAARLVQGHTDSSLTMKGTSQAKALGHWLRAEGIQFSHIYASDLKRARQTSVHALQESGTEMHKACNVQERYALREKFEGSNENKAYRECAFAPQAQGINKRDWRPPGGGESSNDLQHRAVSELGRLMRVHASTSDIPLQHGKSVLPIVALFTHGLWMHECLKFAISHSQIVSGQDKLRRNHWGTWNFPMPNTGIWRLRFEWPIRAAVRAFGWLQNVRVHILIAGQVPHLAVQSTALIDKSQSSMISFMETKSNTAMSHDKNGETVSRKRAHASPNDSMDAFKHRKPNQRTKLGTKPIASFFATKG